MALWAHRGLKEKLDCGREAGIGQGSKHGIPCRQEVSVLCDTDVIACVVIALCPSFLIVLYS